MSQGTYWIVASSATNTEREGLYSVLKSRVAKAQLVSDVGVFEIPLNLKFGSFDDLIRLVDDMGRQDTYCETVMRRLERQALEIDPVAEFKVVHQRNPIPVEQYMRRFSWDDSKFPRARPMKDNLDLIVSSITKLDEEVRGKSAAFNEVKQQHSTATKKENANHTLKDLMDVLTPSVVANDDFIESEHLTTVVAVVPKGLEKDWNASYEHLVEGQVVPRSSKHYNIPDVEGNTLFKVVVFRKHLDAFKVAAKAKRFVIREFPYSENAFRVKIEERSKLEAERTRQETFLSRVCFGAFSDAFVSWVHLKAMRAFVEAVLRFGVPPNFCAFLIKPQSPSKHKKLRKELDDIFASDSAFGKSYTDSAGTDHTAAVGIDLADEEYYPYVSLSLVPFVQAVQK